MPSSVKYSVKTTFDHLYMQLSYKYVVRLQHNSSDSAFITTVTELVRIKTIIGFE